MNRKGITFKLFIITTVSLFLFVSMSMILQSLFFHKFYISERTKHLKNEVINLNQLYIDEIDSTNELFDNIYKFENKNNAQVALLDIRGDITFIRLVPSKKYDSTYKEVMNLAIGNWNASKKSFLDVLISKKTIDFRFENPILNTESLVIVSPIIVNNSIDQILFVVSTLQPIGEASDVMKKYYIYIYIAALCMISILSLYYSRMISKPLISLNSTASKMAALDFTARCHINSNDEIGNLAKTLNFLSEKLNTTLTKLKNANKKLKDDIEKERKLDKMRKEFVAGVSHELKTPISLIEGYAEGLKDGIVEGEEKDYYLDVIIDESKKMNTLIRDMLDISQLESGNYNLNISEFNIYEFIYSVYKKHLYNITDKKLILNYNTSDKNILVNGDEFRIEEVITNLISNAVRYTKPHGKIVISINDHNDKIFIEIENEGEKISEKDLELIWEKFYRVDKSRNKKSGGIGLGLAIVKNILELHNSTYGAINTNTGVAFYFSLEKIIVN